MVRKFDLSRHEMRLVVFSLGACMRLLDDDDPEAKQLGFTREDVLVVLEKLGVDKGTAASMFQMSSPENDWREDER